MSDSLLPPNATAGEIALDESTARVGGVPTPVRTMWNADTCPAPLLPWLAWAFSVDEWDATWTDAQKRAAVKASYEVHRRKGTIGAVRRALDALGLELTIVEWFEDTPVGDPYTFRLSLGVELAGATQEQLAKIIRVVDAAKNLRSHLASIDLSLTSNGVGYFAGVTLSGHEITIEPWAPSEAGVLTEDGMGILTEDGALLITE